MKLRVQVAHQIPGRVRLLLPEHRGDSQLFARLAQELDQTRLFKNVRVNPVTGSVVLEYDGAADDLLARLAAQLPYELELTTPPPPGPALAAVANPLRLVSGRDVNPMVMAGTLFSALGMHQAMRGKIMVPALSAFWYAVNAFRMAREGAPRRDAASST
jgi:hypothetical protein